MAPPGFGVYSQGKEKGANRADGECLCLPRAWHTQLEVNEVLRIPRVAVNFSDLPEYPRTSEEPYLGYWAYFFCISVHINVSIMQVYIRVYITCTC